MFSKMLDIPKKGPAELFDLCEYLLVYIHM